MNFKIYKNDLIKEINEKIKLCKTYQEQNPDIMAAHRVSMLDKKSMWRWKILCKSAIERAWHF
jgi:hypothetical protein